MRKLLKWKYSIGIIGLMLLTGALMGCGEAGGEAGSDEPRVASEGLNEDTDRVEQLIVTYQTYQGSVITDLDEVVNAINEITVPEIGVEIAFRLVDAQEAFTEYPLWISRGERVDLMMLNYQDITAYVARGMLTPLDDLLEAEGKDILKLIAEGYYVTEGAVVKGSTYGSGIVPDMMGSGTGFWVPASLLEEINFDYQEKHIYTWEEMTEFAARCKALYPDKYPIGQITSGLNHSFFSYYGGEIEALGADYVSGVLTTEGKLVNLYETREYYDFLTQMREWYLAGYLYPDTAFTDSNADELAAAGLILSYPFQSAPNDGMNEVFGEEVVCLRTGTVSVNSQHARSGFWTIPVTSQSPEAAMRFLNMMYADERIANLIQYGIKGKHYVVLDVDSGSIALPYGVSRQNTGYYNPLGLYGDRRKIYTFDSNESIRRKREYSAEAMQNRKPFNDFTYSADNVLLELSTARKVVEQYTPLLESGSVDLETCYTEFLLQLRLAGIDKILADKQEQYDRWQMDKGERTGGE